METALKKSELVARLRSDILALQGFRAPALGVKHDDFGLGPVMKAFPEGIFPRVGMHEFVSHSPEQTAATSGFMAALAGKMMKEDGLCVWVGRHRTVYPFALSHFGVAPDRVIFVDLKKEKDLLWAIEEALKCDALSAVVGEIKELNLTESRRLQLTVEKSKVTGLLHRVSPRLSNPVAAVCRWRISPLPGASDLVLPGIGFPRWQVTIEKVRSGEPGSWPLEFHDGSFELIGESVPSHQFISEAG
ncbi:protein ImuA [Dyadobacter sp. BE34]|uniref:Protein ImuA n=1 Tax=Dyadobacter fermentans TaxID=94254 RepID=A0ABU1R657_9BACT|nr:MULTISPECIES: Error-prone repair protein ImuA [Dyadobacter]MDR6808838.1 protein ImuA [Dyadobacter fermentans]MDR7046581.1 protein ImuA [Dyadobacter sp. BE242]MDR7200894.1 protein ImuA [Dyadobacter sp. BE34]MDR7218855.1 protein ImuA [Dyadobacter sp. BE31]MDR7266784.1 protein ImuA [Dyadobacter sp. BE32]